MDKVLGTCAVIPYYIKQIHQSFLAKMKSVVLFFESIMLFPSFIPNETDLIYMSAMRYDMIKYPDYCKAPISKYKIRET